MKYLVLTRGNEESCQVFELPPAPKDRRHYVVLPTGDLPPRPDVSGVTEGSKSVTCEGRLNSGRSGRVMPAECSSIGSPEAPRKNKGLLGDQRNTGFEGLEKLEGSMVVGVLQARNLQELYSCLLRAGQPLCGDAPDGGKWVLRLNPETGRYDLSKDGALILSSFDGECFRRAEENGVRWQEPAQPLAADTQRPTRSVA